MLFTRSTNIGVDIKLFIKHLFLENNIFTFASTGLASAHYIELAARRPKCKVRNVLECGDWVFARTG